MAKLSIDLTPEQIAQLGLVSKATRWDLVPLQVAIDEARANFAKLRQNVLQLQVEQRDPSVPNSSDLTDSERGARTDVEDRFSSSR